MLIKNNNETKWFALARLGEVLREGSDKDLVKSEEAFYYVKYFCDKLYIYNSDFKATPLSYDKVIGCDTELKLESGEWPNKSFNVFMFDKCREQTSNIFKEGILGIEQCIQYMKKLNSYPSKAYMKLSVRFDKKEEELKAAIISKMEIEAKNEEILTKLNTIYESKKDLKKLVALLYD